MGSSFPRSKTTSRTTGQPVSPRTQEQRDKIEGSILIAERAARLIYSGQSQAGLLLIRAQKDPVMSSVQATVALGFLLTGGPAAAVQMMKRVTEHYA